MDHHFDRRDTIGHPGQKRLVLCFDGTGKAFRGTEKDTNIVKIYQFLDRSSPNQYHYYQRVKPLPLVTVLNASILICNIFFCLAGIGTYVDTATPFIGPLKTAWTKILLAADLAYGITFRAHVIAGYQFIMRYWTPGDAIYMFGFSRGAYTVRFLAEMIHSVGLLSRGNEEMVRFAWQAFSDYQNAMSQSTADTMSRFKETFCREGCNVHFLGLFDCVNSVGQFEPSLFGSLFDGLRVHLGGSPSYYAHVPDPPATHVRHAVAIHERRIKFKPALFASSGIKSPDLKEVWFAGNHEDVGGGYAYVEGQRRLLSDDPLQWMIDEVTALDGPDNKISFKTTVVPTWEAPRDAERYIDEPTTEGGRDLRELSMKLHDELAFTGATIAYEGGKLMGWVGALFWWFVETIPIFFRLELEDDVWVPRYWPPNLGENRDIPVGADIHPSVKGLCDAGVLSQAQMPTLGGNGKSKKPSAPPTQGTA